jgi:hypothetical protein
VALLINLVDGSSVEILYILIIAIGAFSLIGELKCKYIIIVARLIGYILLHVSKGVEEEYKFNKYLKDWQRHCRRFAF